MSWRCTGAVLGSALGSKVMCKAWALWCVPCLKLCTAWTLRDGFLNLTAHSRPENWISNLSQTRLDVKVTWVATCNDLWSDRLGDDDTLALEQDAIMQRDFIPVVPDRSLDSLSININQVLFNWNRYLAFLFRPSYQHADLQSLENCILLCRFL